MIKIYKKASQKKISITPRTYIKILGLVLSFFGLIIVFYIFSPIISWEIFLSPVLSAQSITIPIPQTTLVTPGTIKSLLLSQVNIFNGVDYTDAKNWFPTYTIKNLHPTLSAYTISISRLSIKNALVSTIDTDLAHHLIQLDGTSIPPEKGNVVIFGHSTLPALYNPNDYKTIFANIHTLQVGDTIEVRVNSIIYTYKVFSITIIDPDDTSVLGQNIDDSYLTLITCTPPGTIWKRLVLKARLQSL
jgi:sortase A